MTRVLVLGGGGMTGIAWEFGVLGGLRVAGVDLGDADTIVGTSAGSVVGTVLAAGIDLDEAVQRHRAPVAGPAAAAADITPALAAFGPNVLDPAARRPAVEAGLRQGRALADAVREVWAFSG